MLGAREDLVAVQTADSRDLRRVGGEQHGVGAERLARGGRQVAQVHLVVKVAEAILVLYLPRAAERWKVRTQAGRRSRHAKRSCPSGALARLAQTRLHYKDPVPLTSCLLTSL